ncbi:MAG TPA: LptE family protein [Terriglobales bacterium]|nr:LptE family protein [Terriglobales bacterium]
MATVLAVVLLLGLSGCGYHTAGQATKLPADLHTIAIPMFENHTTSYRVEQTLTGAVVREFTSRTNYRIANRDTSDADATLHGSVLSTYISPLTYDSTTGRTSSALVTVNMKVTLTGRDGKVLFENPNYSFRQQYEVSREVSSFFQEESPALERLSRDFARTLVSNILEDY